MVAWSPSDAELEAMVEHIAFDMRQLDRMRPLLPRGGAATDTENAAVVAFLLAARNLLGFFDPPPQRDHRRGDVFAFQFVPGWVMPEPGWNHSTADMRRAISTRVAHICLDRTEKLGWVVPVIYGPLERASASFFRSLDEPTRQRFREFGVAAG